MKLYIKQKLFSFKDRFRILDEHENLAYEVEGKVFTFRDKFHILDASGNEVLYIEQELWHFRPYYKIISPDGTTLVVRQDFTFFKPSYRIEGSDWQIKGDVWGHEYELTSQNEVIMSISKKWFALSDTYELNVKHDEFAPICLAIVIIIDACNKHNNNAAAGGAANG